MLMLKKIFATAYQYTQTIKQSNNQTNAQMLINAYNGHHCLKMLVNACPMLINVGKPLKNFAHVYQCLLLMNTALE